MNRSGQVAGGTEDAGRNLGIEGAQVGGAVVLQPLPGGGPLVSCGADDVPGGSVNLPRELAGAFSAGHPLRTEFIAPLAERT